MAKFAIIALFFIPFVLFLAWLAFGFVGMLQSEKRERESPTVFHPNRAYINWTPRDGWPRGPFLNYECAICGKALPSKPRAEMKCRCGNLVVDVGRIGADDETKIRIFEEKPDGLV